jgi:chitosanase
MILTPRQKSICERVLNAFETGTADGDYANISIFHDGPHGIRQVTYGRSQTTEYGKLQDLVARYASAGGRFSAELAPFVPLVGHTPLVDHAQFKLLLRRAGGEDPIMMTVQDQFFDERYFAPALKWADDFGFQEALAMLVIYDSFVHSGGILAFLRSRFPEVPPASGGNERTWISQYVGVRHEWLAHHSNSELRPTVYRTKCFRFEIERGNWDLAQVPINANGTLVGPAADGQIVLGNLPPIAPVAVPTPASDFAAKTASVAIEQWTFFGEQRYNRNGSIIHSGHKEGEDGWWQRVGVYWAHIGRDDLDGRDHEWPWSAAFISWVMRQAGAEGRFTYSASHATYISKSIRDRNQGNTNALYWGFRLSERKPQVGDLVCWDRDREKVVDYDHQHGGDYKSHTDLVVAVGGDEIEVIGGNVGNSVTRRPVALNADGFLVGGEQGGEILFAIMGCRLR